MPDATLHLALMDGLVALNTASGEVNLKRGDDVLLSFGQAPRVTALVNANAMIQWALYYPAVINPDDLPLSTPEADALNDVLEKYRSGDLLGALAAWPDRVHNGRCGSLFSSRPTGTGRRSGG